jgi:hypothetical protein
MAQHYRASITPWHSTTLPQLQNGTALPCINYRMAQHCHASITPWHSTTLPQLQHDTALPCLNYRMASTTLPQLQHDTGPPCFNYSMTQHHCVYIHPLNKSFMCNASWNIKCVDASRGCNNKVVTIGTVWCRNRTVFPLTLLKIQSIIL